MLYPPIVSKNTNRTWPTHSGCTCEFPKSTFTCRILCKGSTRFVFSPVCVIPLGMKYSVSTGKEFSVCLTEGAFIMNSKRFLYYSLTLSILWKYSFTLSMTSWEGVTSQHIVILLAPRTCFRGYLIPCLPLCYILYVSWYIWLHLNKFIIL